MKILRNIAHYILYFIWMYTIGHATHIAEWVVYEQIIFMTIAPLIIGGGFGFAWEWCQSVFLINKFDEKDILRSTTGALIGGYTYVIWNDLQIIHTWGLYASFAVVLFSVGRGLWLMKKQGNL